MRRVFVIIVFMFALLHSIAVADVVQLAGPDGSGYLSFSEVKNWNEDPAPGDSGAFDPGTETLYPYYYNPDKGIWVTIAAGPLSVDSTYAEEATFAVLNKTITQNDFATISAGQISYDSSLLTGSGIETIGVDDLAFNFNTYYYNGSHGGFAQAGYISPFSPIDTPYNTGSGSGNFGWSYIVSASNWTGAGLTFVDGNLLSLEANADIAIQVLFANNPTLGFAETYDGTFSASGNQYYFNIDETKTSVVTPFGDFTDTRMVFNRTGSIAAIPEPSCIVIFAFSACGVLAVRKRHR